MAVLEKL